MTSDYKVGRCTRRCGSLDRPLRPGEWYYSVVEQRDDELVRRDVSAEAWKGPPEGAIGWWKSRMPTTEGRRLKLAPDAALVDLLVQLGDQPQREATRYLLALLLLRRRLVRPVDGAARSGGGAMVLEVAADGSRVEVAECEITSDRQAAVQAELMELLYVEAD